MTTRSATARWPFAVLAAALLLGLPARAAEADPVAREWAASQKLFSAHKARNDFDAARTALRSFVEQYPDAPQTAAARADLKAIEAAADHQIKALWEDAETFSRRKLYNRALEFYTELITRNSSPEWVKKAQEAIERNDAAGEPAFSEVKKKTDEAFAAWDFTAAAKTAAAGRDGFDGTKWANQVANLSAEMEIVRAFFAGLIARVAATRDAPKKSPFKLPDPTGWQVRADIVGADEHKLSLSCSGAGREMAWKDMTTDRLLEVFGLYDLKPADHLALGLLFLRQGKKEAAAARFLAARADAALFDRAEHYLKIIAGRLNEVTYDFSHGLQILDWEAHGGRWLITAGELVQESADGDAELALVKHTHKAREVRFFFDLTARSDKGALSVFFVDDEKNSFGFAFSREGYTAFASVDGKVVTAKDDKFRLPADKKVHLRCGLKGDEFALSVDERKMPRLTAPGLAKLEGHFILRTLDGKAAFDNIEISNRAE